MKLVALSITLGLAATFASADVLTLGSTGTFTRTTGASLVSDDTSLVSVLSSNHLSFRRNSNVSFKGNRSVLTQYIENDKFLEFDVTSPVLVSNLSITSNHKVVNGGGSSTDPLNKCFVGVELLQYIDDNASGHFEASEDTAYFVPMSASLYTGSLSGNGFKVLSHATDVSFDPAYVLGAGQHYVILNEMTQHITYSTPNNSFPDNIYTFESQAPGFEGTTVEFDYQAVPEPATLLALGVALVGLRRRRK